MRLKSGYDIYRIFIKRTLSVLDKLINNEFIQNSIFSEFLTHNSMLQVGILKGHFFTYIHYILCISFYGIKYMYLLFLGNTSKHKMLV